MRYHYKITRKSHIPEARKTIVDSSIDYKHRGFSSKEMAELAAIHYLQDNKLSKEDYEVEITPIAENVVEEDRLKGVMFPANEMTDDEGNYPMKIISNIYDERNYTDL